VRGADSIETQDASKRAGGVVARCRVGLNVADNSYAVCSARAPGKTELLRYAFDFVGPDTRMTFVEKGCAGRTLVPAGAMASSSSTIGFPKRGMGPDGH